MVTKPRNLRLVSPDSEAQDAPAMGAQEGFALVALGELTQAEQRIIDHLVGVAAEQSGIIAIARTESPWDLRPVVMRAGEVDPSIVRLVNPPATLNQESFTRLQSIFERLSTYVVDSGALFDWGLLDNGQIWYRRTLHNKTLAHDLQGGVSWSAEKLVEFTVNLIEQVISLHAYGIVHGHISTSNIVLDSKGMPQLLDVGVAVAQLQAGIIRDLSLAPDTRSTQSHVLPPVDAYGVGQVCKRLILRAQRDVFEREYEEELLLDALTERVQPLLHQVPRSRAALHQTLIGIRQLAHVPTDTSVSGTRGKIVQVAPVEQSQQRSAPIAVELKDEQIRTAVNVSEPSLSLDDEQSVGREPAPSAPTSRGSSWWLYAIGLASIAFCLWTYQQRLIEQQLEVNAEDLRVAWLSGMPSQMKPVVLLAREQPRSFAEQLLVRSALRGENLPQGIATDLIRIAFDTRWEDALSDADRQAAITLGTSGFIRPADTKALNQLEQRHAGVLLAITATAPDQARTTLAKLPAEKLGTLPGPLGRGFAALLAVNPQSTCADESIRELARFIAFGAERPSQIALFLERDFTSRLQALSELFAEDQGMSKLIVEAVLRHPNSAFSEPVVAWGKKWSLEQWELSPGGQLQILAGYAPREESLDTKYVAALFAHPIATIRKHAVTEARDRIAFAHPGSMRVLSAIIESPESVSAEQLMSLAKILEAPEKMPIAEIQSWFTTNPSKQIVLELLLASAKGQTATHVDTLAAMYLNSKGWKPTKAQAQLLVSHPDDYTRMLSYQAIFSEQTTESLSLLQNALIGEKNTVFREQLALMLEQLHSALHP